MPTPKETLTRYVSKSMLTAREQEITAVVKATSTDELHEAYQKMTGFAGMFAKAVKEEMIVRAKKAKAAGEQLVTAIGKISLSSKPNYTDDIDGIMAWLKKHRKPVETLFDVSYVVETKNPAVLAALKEQGAISQKVGNLDRKKFEDLVLQYPELATFSKNDPTEYVRGL